MRIHGDKIVTRRSVVEKRTPYGEYLDILREDFAGICGYCGKSEYVTKNAFEIDHFIPRKYAPELEEDYHAMNAIEKRHQNGHLKIKTDNFLMALVL